MTNLKMQPSVWRGLLVGSTMVAAAMLSASATAGQKQNADQRVCADMGAGPGSPAYADCMLQQQQRRDQKMSVFLEHQLMHQELGRPAREKLEEKKERRAREKWRDSRCD